MNSKTADRTEASRASPVPQHPNEVVGWAQRWQPGSAKGPDHQAGLWDEACPKSGQEVNLQVR